jgi:hypothetical protein
MTSPRFEKRVVHYIGTPLFTGSGAFKIALVEPIDHPHCSNTRLVRTSRVIHDNGINGFETENSIYQPADPHRV